MARRTTAGRQWGYFVRQSRVVKQRTIEPRAVISQVEALMEVGMTKSAVVDALGSLGITSAARIWNWLGAVSRISRHDRLLGRMMSR